MAEPGDGVPSAVGKPHPEFDVDQVRRDFPALDQDVHDRQLVYLDNAASTQKPSQVIEAIRDLYRRDYSNVHRGVHALSQRATDLYENAREGLAGFVGARDPEEVVWTRGTTEAVNLVAQAWARPRIGLDDAILITEMEHHSNIVPWQQVRDATGCELRVADVTDAGELDLDDFEAKLTDDVALVAVSHVSNVLGTINPVADLTDRAHDAGAAVLVDGAQAVPHMPVDVQAIDCDFYVLSGHKMYGPTGIGALIAKDARLDEAQAYQGGGEMITSVSIEETTYKDPPYKFEAGTPNIAGVVGLGAAVDYLQTVGIDRVSDHEADVTDYGMDRLADVDGLRLIGTADEKAGVLSFVLEDVHAHDVGTILDREGVAIRAGHHCAQPLMNRFGVPATARASLGLYNKEAEIDALVDAIETCQDVFG